MQLAADLHTLLQRAAVPGPYVLAGHSIGGTYALTFAARYPRQVAGMVLLDSSTPGNSPPCPAIPPQLARLSANSLHRTVPGADHTALLYDEAMSANSSQAIRDVVSAIRTGTPLKA